MRAATRTSGSTNPGSRITFADIFSYLYVPQSDMNRDIARSQDQYLAPKRKAVFELLFGLTDKALQALRSDATTLNGKVEGAKPETATIRDFLKTTNTISKKEALNAVGEAANEQIAAEAAIRVLRDEINPVADRETQVMRDLLNDSEARLAEAKAAVTSLIRQSRELTAERRRVIGDLTRLARMRDAGDRIANIEFITCPRCLQSLTGRPVPDGACRVCLQHDPLPATLPMTSTNSVSSLISSGRWTTNWRPSPNSSAPSTTPSPIVKTWSRTSRSTSSGAPPPG